MQFWMSPHPPVRGIRLLGTRPSVHTGFHKAWTARGLHIQVIQCLQVRFHYCWDQTWSVFVCARLAGDCNGAMN